MTDTPTTLQEPTQACRMKLAIVAPCFGTLGGIETFICALAWELVRQPGLKVTLCFKKTVNFKLDWLLEKVAHDTGADIVFVERSSRELAAVIRNADIVHCQNPCFDVVFLAKLFGKPVLLTVHNRRLGGWHPREVLRRVAWWLADRRWYNSEFCWNTWDRRRRMPGSGRFHVLCRLPTGIVPPAQRKGFIFVARWIPNKGLETLIEAYRQARLDRKQWPLMLLGDGSLRTSIEAKIRDERIEGIDIRGHVSEEERNDAVRHARWLVAPPNTKEDLGATPIEARHVAVPCIITRDGGLPEAGGRHALICEPANVEELTVLLEKAARMELGEYERLCEATHKELLEYLSPLSQYLVHCRQLTGGKGANPQPR